MQIALVIGSTISTIKDEVHSRTKTAHCPQGGYGGEYDRRAVRRSGYGQCGSRGSGPGYRWFICPIIQIKPTTRLSTR